MRNHSTESLRQKKINCERRTNSSRSIYNSQRFKLFCQPPKEKLTESKALPSKPTEAINHSERTFPVPLASSPKSQ